MGITKGAAAFEAHYRAIYGQRWEALRDALLRPPRRVAFQEGLIKPYFLDPASVLAAQCLPLDDDQVVGDFCAAPGGKSLVLTSRLPEGARLYANEPSFRRRRRLLRVLREHLSPETRQRLTVLGWDARRLGRQRRAFFDAVLLDVPCSGERHLLAQPKYLGQWSPTRGKRLSNQALAMALAALDSLREGGFLLYCTCSLNPLENDQVLERLARRRQGQWTVVELPPTLGETTRYGRLILPDRADGLGPLYLSLLQKLPTGRGET